ncbi:DDN1 protein, partial [Rhinopomastus cyanomelas]|nr:DDN1 protein [Rhinopomastus cyanomelas]
LLTSVFSLLPWAGAGRIIGGREAEPHSRPYMAYVQISHRLGTACCGGFLIRSDAVLSAAHCVAGKENVKINVTLGAHNIKRKEQSQQVFRIKDGNWVRHPNYSRVTRENDIMLLKLEPKAKLTKEVAVVPLASLKTPEKPGTTCSVSGWGWTSLKKRRTNVLMEVDLTVQSYSVCEHVFKKFKEKSMICVGDNSGRKSTYKGDSGGPLVCSGKAHGIVSYGRKKRLFPKVFTRISYFYSWVWKELRKL